MCFNCYLIYIGQDTLLILLIRFRVNPTIRCSQVANGVTDTIFLVDQCHIGHMLVTHHIVVSNSILIILYVIYTQTLKEHNYSSHEYLSRPLKDRTLDFWRKNQTKCAIRPVVQYNTVISQSFQFQQMYVFSKLVIVNKLLTIAFCCSFVIPRVQQIKPIWHNFKFFTTSQIKSNSNTPTDYLHPYQHHNKKKTVFIPSPTQNENHIFSLHHFPISKTFQMYSTRGFQHKKCKY